MKLNSQINIVLTNEKLEKGFEKLKNLGFKLSHFPLIKTLPIKLDLNFNISDFNCIIFTSKNGVEYFLKNKLVQKTKLKERYYEYLEEGYESFEAMELAKRDIEERADSDLALDRVLEDYLRMIYQQANNHREINTWENKEEFLKKSSTSFIFPSNSKTPLSIK